MKVAYVAGLPRSGTTVVQALLSSSGSTMALGEILGSIWKFTQPDPLIDEWKCSCGSERAHCKFWGEVLPKLRGVDIGEGYRIIVDRFAHENQDLMLIDSSKSLVPLERFYAGSSLDVRVLLVTRDFRGWIASYRKYRARRHPERRPFADSYLAFAYRWWRQYRQLIRYLTDSRFRWKLLSYDQLVFEPQEQLSAVAQFLDVDGFSMSPRWDRMHELLGSPTLRSGFGEDIRLTYDSKWMADPTPRRLAPLLGPVFRLNESFHREG